MYTQTTGFDVVKVSMQMDHTVVFTDVTKAFDGMTQLLLANFDISHSQKFWCEQSLLAKATAYYQM